MTIDTLNRAKGKTIAAVIAQRMRDDIITCRLPPGEPLKFDPLRASFGASFTTLREALTTLTADGLVVAEGQRGYHVAPASAADLHDLTNTRVLVEGEALRLAIAQGGDDWEIALMTGLHRLSKAAEQAGDGVTDDPAWRQAHAQFHLLLVSACASPTLLAIRSALFDRTERYRSLSAAYRPRPRDKSGEHRALMLAAISRNAGLAASLLEAHIRGTADNVLRYAGHVLSGGK